MKNKTIITAATFALCVSALIASASDPLAGLKNRDPNAGPTVITSDRMEFDYKEFIALFEGNVKVNDPQFTLTADKMLIFFENANEVKSVNATGSVKIVSKSNDTDDIPITITSVRATYTARNGLVLVQSKPGEPMPVVTKGENRITGAKMSVWLIEERVVVEEDVVVETNTSQK